MDKVFVYGTLKRGHGNNRLLEGCICLGEYITIPTFSMYNVGFPVTFYAPKGERVLGELFEIPDSILDVTLARLDRLEGTPHMYSREHIRVLALGTSEPAIDTYMYVGVPGYWNRRHGLPAAVTVGEEPFLTWGGR